MAVYSIFESFRVLRLNFWKWMKQFDHQDFQILELGSPGTSWFWQLVQALVYTPIRLCGSACSIKSMQVTYGLLHAQTCPGIGRERRPRSASASAQTRQDLPYSLTEWIHTTECMNEEQGPGWYFLHAQDNLNLRIMHFFAWHDPDIIISFSIWFISGFYFYRSRTGTILTIEHMFLDTITGSPIAWLVLKLKARFIT